MPARISTKSPREMVHYLLKSVTILIAAMITGCGAQNHKISFVKPFGIQVDSKGNIFVSEPTTGVVVLDKNLKQIATFNGLAFAHNVAETNIGTYLVADWEGSRVVEFNINGERINSIFEEEGSGPANVYQDLAGNIWISDFKRHKVIKIDSKGIKTEPLKSSNIEHPHGVATDSNDNIYIIESFKNRILKFNSTGAYMSWIGAKENGTTTDGWQHKKEQTRSGEEHGALSVPASIQIYNDKYIIVSEVENSRVQAFNLSTGRSIGISKAGYNRPYGAVVKGDKLYVADTHNDQIVISKKLDLIRQK